MPSTTTVTATIEDADAVPVMGASVTLTPDGQRQSVRAVAVSAGQYEARDLTPGAYQIRLARRGFLTDSYRLHLRPGANNRGFVLGRPGERHFYAAGQRVYFRPVEDRVLLAVYGPDASSRLYDVAAQREVDLQQVMPIRAGGQPNATMRAVPVTSSQAPLSNAIAGMRDDLERQGLQVIPALLIQRGSAPPQGLTQDLVVQFQTDVDEDEARTIAADEGLEVRRPILSTPNAWLLHDPDGPTYELLDAADRLVDLARVLSAEPDLLMQLEVDQYTPNDTLYNLQTHLPQANADDAWEAVGTWLGPAQRGGSPDICIAVFDPQGVAPDHPELTANLSNGVGKLLTSFDFGAMAAQTVNGLGGDHGTQCAGTATAAFDNNQGIAGVAPNCRVIGAEIPNPATGVLMADAFLWAAGIDNGNPTPGFPALPNQPADVISNSWGVGNAALSTALQNAFDRLTDDGRDGRGCVVTFSTGNLGYVQFSNVRRFAAYDRNVAVGASINVNPTSPVTSSQADPNGNTNNLVATVDTRAFYSPFGPELDVVAPSHTCYDNNGNLVDPTTSTVRVGQGGLDGCPGAPVCMDYATTFGGTSHASPTIAGTAALVLSVFPVLDWAEARAILRWTAVRIDAGQANAIGQYIDNDGDGVAEFSQWYGFGRVDVAGAVDEAAKMAVATFQAWS